MQKQAYRFIENDAVVPTENTIYVLYHDVTKVDFNMTKNKTDATNQCI